MLDALFTKHYGRCHRCIVAKSISKMLEVARRKHHSRCGPGSDSQHGLWSRVGIGSTVSMITDRPPRQPGDG